MDNFKDVTIEGRTFRIGRISASTGNWIVNSFQAARTDEKLFRAIQGYCWEACSVLKDVEGQAPVPMPVFKRPDQWIPASMAQEFDVAQQLYDAVIDFNFAEFFKRFFAKMAQAENALTAAESQTTPR